MVSFPSQQRFSDGCWVSLDRVATLLLPLRL